MHVHSASKIDAVKEFRKKGLSIKELMIRFQMPKTTVWHHIRNLKLSERQRRRIKEKNGGSKLRVARQREMANILAGRITNMIDMREIAPFVLSLLYWAEGSKRALVFTNTDSDMIKIFLKVLRETYGVDNSRITAIIRINNFQNSSECFDYWRKITRISPKNISVNLNLIQNKGKSKYGVLRITIKRGGYLLKLVNSLNRELTLRTLSSILKTTSPLVAQMDQSGSVLRK